MNPKHQYSELTATTAAQMEHSMINDAARKMMNIGAASSTSGLGGPYINHSQWVSNTGQYTSPLAERSNVTIDPALNGFHVIINGKSYVATTAAEVGDLVVSQLVAMRLEK